GLSDPDGLAVEEPAATPAAAALRGAASPRGFSVGVAAAVARRDAAPLLDAPGPPGSVGEGPAELAGAALAGAQREHSVIDVIDLSLSGTLETVEDVDTPARARDKHSVAELSLSGTLETLGNARTPGASGAGTAAAPAARGEAEQAVLSTEASLVDLTGSNWQWYHRTGFRCYTAAEAERIEEAWRSGESKVRLKAGKTGKTPMQIFFADMIQLDPTSGNERKVRRTGDESLFGWLERNLLWILKGIHTGQLRWETSKQYKKRQTDQKEKQPAIDQSMMVNMSQMFSPTQISSGQFNRRAHIGLWCGRLVQAYWWRI
ncbi:unnamed protein product, partial [Prorocentrum cordatum]